MMAIGTGTVVLLGRRFRLAAYGALAAWSVAIVFAPPYLSSARIGKAPRDGVPRI